MSKIGIGAPITIFKGNLMECTWTSEVTREQGMVKTQPEILEVGKGSLFPHIWSLNCALIVECPMLT